ncbi:hypothetical protein Tco_1568738 [Tanacetum coccineum]
MFAPLDNSGLCITGPVPVNGGPVAKSEEECYRLGQRMVEEGKSEVLCPQVANGQNWKKVIGRFLAAKGGS